MTRQQIIQAIAELPVKERMALVRDLQQAAAIDADYFSSGRPDDNGAYLKLLEQDNQQEQSLEATYAQTAAKAITPASMKKETQSIVEDMSQRAATLTAKNIQDLKESIENQPVGPDANQNTTPTPPGHVPDANNSGSNSDEKQPGDNLKEANKEQGLPGTALAGQQ